MKSELKYITFEWDEENKELLLERDGAVFSVPFRNISSLFIFIGRIYRKYLHSGIVARKAVRKK